MKCPISKHPKFKQYEYTIHQILFNPFSESLLRMTKSKLDGVENRIPTTQYYYTYVA